MERRTFLKLLAASPVGALRQQQVETIGCTYGSGLYSTDIYNGSCTPTNITLKTTTSTSQTTWITSGIVASLLGLLTWRIRRLKTKEAL